MGEGSLQPRPCSDPVGQIPKAAHEPWYRGRILICWLVFQWIWFLSFGAAWFMGSLDWQPGQRFMAICLFGSAAAAAVFVCVAEAFRRR